ncbi:MAG: hypothetical protein ACK4R6_14575 [Spirosomataceae bacterium]
MKQLIWLLFFFGISNISYGKGKLDTIDSTLSVVQRTLKSLNVQIENDNIVIDTLLKDKEGVILSIIDSLSIKNIQGEPLVFFADNKLELLYVGKFGRNSILPATFSIKKFPNNDKLIIMEYGEMGQGIVEESLTLFRKTNRKIQQLYPTIFETGIANTGLCPDLEKCYEYTTRVVDIKNEKITFHKKGNILNTKTGNLKLIDNFFFLNLEKEEWKLKGNL